MDESNGVLYQQGRYVVVTINDFLKDNRVIDAYAVINLQTSVCEYETRMLWDACNWCKRCELLVSKLENDGDGEPSIEWDTDDE